MESTGPKLSSLASMPRLHYNSGEFPDSIAPVQASRELAGRAVYPVTLKLELDQKALVGCKADELPVLKSCSPILQVTQGTEESALVSIQLQHDEVDLDRLLQRLQYVAC